MRDGLCNSEQITPPGLTDITPLRDHIMGMDVDLELKYNIAVTKPWDGKGSSPECGSSLITALPTITTATRLELITN